MAAQEWEGASPSRTYSHTPMPPPAPTPNLPPGLFDSTAELHRISMGFASAIGKHTQNFLRVLQENEARSRRSIRHAEMAEYHAMVSTTLIVSLHQQLIQKKEQDRERAESARSQLPFPIETTEAIVRDHREDWMMGTFDAVCQLHALTLRQLSPVASAVPALRADREQLQQQLSANQQRLEDQRAETEEREHNLKLVQDRIREELERRSTEERKRLELDRQASDDRAKEAGRENESLKEQLDRVLKERDELQVIAGRKSRMVASECQTTGVRMRDVASGGEAWERQRTRSTSTEEGMSYVTSLEDSKRTLSREVSEMKGALEERDILLKEQEVEMSRLSFQAAQLSGQVGQIATVLNGAMRAKNPLGSHKPGMEQDWAPRAREERVYRGAMVNISPPHPRKGNLRGAPTPPLPPRLHGALVGSEFEREAPREQRWPEVEPSNDTPYEIARQGYESPGHSHRGVAVPPGRRTDLHIHISDFPPDQTAPAATPQASQHSPSNSSVLDSPHEPGSEAAGTPGPPPHLTVP